MSASKHFLHLLEQHERLSRTSDTHQDMTGEIVRRQFPMHQLVSLHILLIGDQHLFQYIFCYHIASFSNHDFEFMMQSYKNHFENTRKQDEYHQRDMEIIESTQLIYNLIF